MVVGRKSQVSESEGESEGVRERVALLSLLLLLTHTRNDVVVVVVVVFIFIFKSKIIFINSCEFFAPFYLSLSRRVVSIRRERERARYKRERLECRR